MSEGSVFSELAAALRQRRAVIADHAFRDRDPAAHLETLRSVSQQIVELQQRLPAGTSNELLHYLDRCSYDKALALVEERLG